jgi:hypothetical protein
MHDDPLEQATQSPALSQTSPPPHDLPAGLFPICTQRAWPVVQSVA